MLAYLLAFERTLIKHLYLLTYLAVIVIINYQDC